MKWFEAFRQKRTLRHERDAPKAVKPVDDVVGEAAPTLSANEPSERIALLTPREHELFLLLLEGYTLKESAKQLSIKYSTANTHMTGIYKKLNVSSRAELIIKYHDTGKKIIFNHVRNNEAEAIYFVIFIKN
ncbi:MAG: response regulator transcription factor [Clostridiales bacterium]|nr:response regulator transcription factor [Clostridiales bacterium]